MTPSALPVGLNVRICVSDPFELMARPLEATVVASGVAADAPEVRTVLLRLRTPIDFRAMQWEYLVARPMGSSKDFEDIAANSSVDSALTGVSQERAASSDPLDLSWWRGGLAMLGSISKL